MIKTVMDYTNSNGWIVAESSFNSRLLGKCESIMSLGNGYMGLRSATEENYLTEQRGLLVAGTFNKFDDNEVTELPNSADVIAMEIEINGEIFNLEQGEIKNYRHQLNLKTGELSRKVHWVSTNKNDVNLIFKRIVSLAQLHIIAQKVQITASDTPLSVRLTTGIDGRMTNSGSQHFSEGDKRLYDKKFMQYVQTTSQSKIDFVFSTGLKFFLNHSEIEVPTLITMDRRRIVCTYKFEVAAGETIEFEKISNVYTSRDKENEDINVADIQNKSLENLRADYSKGYDILVDESSLEWEKKLWNVNPILVESENPFDQLSIHFMQYHLQIMTPAHDNRMSIAAKGLSGEGYKGHTFWDTDIFALPYFIYTNPQTARKLEEYRYLSLPGSHEKSKSNGYEGAQYPWESAWLDEGEVTPVWGAADIITGLPTKIWSGFIEQHITSDVAFGVWQYYKVTNDEDFMEKCGYEIMLDTAKFWVSRLDWSNEDSRYHIKDVIGPDEYKEHVNDNAFTNYMAHWNICKATEYYRMLKEQKPELFKKLSKKLDLERVFKEWEQKRDLIYIPTPREQDQVIAQDTTYLTLKDIDLTKYKDQTQVGSMFLEYNLEQANKIQVSKQADIMILFLLLEDLFTQEVKKANWNYYEPRTLHDSSLSLSTHCILALDMGDSELGYDMFQRACRIDLGENMKSSDDGIHAASIGGIWQSVVFGFGGVRMLNGKLRISPSLPRQWRKLSFYIFWHGQKLLITVTPANLSIKNETNTQTVSVTIFNRDLEVNGSLDISY